MKIVTLVSAVRLDRMICAYCVFNEVFSNEALLGRIVPWGSIWNKVCKVRVFPLDSIWNNVWKVRIFPLDSIWNNVWKVRMLPWDSMHGDFRRNGERVEVALFVCAAGRESSRRAHGHDLDGKS